MSHIYILFIIIVYFYSQLSVFMINGMIIFGVYLGIIVPATYVIPIIFDIAN